MTATSGDLARFAKPRYAKNTNGWPTSANQICVQTCESGQLGSYRTIPLKVHIYSSTRFCPFELGVGIRGTVNLGATTWQHVIRWDRVIRLTRWGIEAALWASKDSRTAPFPQFPNISSKLKETSGEINITLWKVQLAGVSVAFLLRLGGKIPIPSFDLEIVLIQIAHYQEKYTKIMSVLVHCFSNITGFLNLWSQRRVATNHGAS